MIELQDVHKTYDTGTIALNGISMKIDDGEFVFLVGPSGSGKSTIIKILTAELRPTSGSALVNGFAVEKLRSRAVPYLRRTLGVIFQDFRLIGDKSVYENVAFAMRVIGAPEKEIQKRVPYVLELVGLETKAAGSRTSCPAASSSASPSQERLSTIPASSSPTSRRATLTRRVRSKL